MPVHKDKKTNTWYFKCCINSTQYLRRGYRTKNEALKNELLFKIEFLDKKQSRNVITFDTGINLYFNYLKTTACNIVGNIPQNYLNILKSIFDKGVTIWHNEQMFDYSQNNDEI